MQSDEKCQAGESWAQAPVTGCSHPHPPLAHAGRLGRAQEAAQAFHGGLALLRSTGPRSRPEHARLQMDWAPAALQNRTHTAGETLPPPSAGSCPHECSAYVYATLPTLHVLYAVQIPDDIAKPDYYLTGIPRSEVDSKQQQIGGLVDEANPKAPLPRCRGCLCPIL